MTDFFREVDEELRNDRMRTVWKNYRVLIIGAVVLIVGATAAYRFIIYWTGAQAAASGDKYLQALQLAEDGDRASAQILFKELEQDGYGSYPMLARFRGAGAMAASGSNNEAIKAFDRLADDTSVPGDLRDYARLQASLIAVDIEDYDKITSRTEGLLSDENPWRHLAREALALSAWKAGNLDEAAKWVQELKITSDIPQGLRQRIQVLEDLIISQGGTLPGVGEAG